MPDTKSSEVIKQALRLTSSGHSSKAIADDVDCSPSLVNAWRSGQRIPSNEQAQRLAKYLFPKDSEKQRWLERSLDQARDPQKVSLLKELDQNSRALRVGSTSRSSYGRKGFLDQFIARFFRLAGIQYRFVERDELVDLKEQLVQDEVDVGIGIFATLDRSLMIKFFTTPIRVGLNAIVLEETLRRTGVGIKPLRKILAPEELGASPEPNLSVAPVVVRSDVGGIYASKTLGFSESNLEFAANHHYSTYGDKLIAQEKDYVQAGLLKTPVALVDDVTALYILLYLDKQGVRARLVFPFSTELSAGLEKKWMPEYLVSISIKRTNVELVDYLRDALRLFLRTEVQMISSFYKDVCLQFEDLATELCVGNRSWEPDDLSRVSVSNPGEENRACARAWVEYTFGLSSAQLEVHQDLELPWKPILQKSKMMYELSKKERAAIPQAEEKLLRRSRKARSRL
jgi:DNA-binding transcriptional LysR family regulator